MGSFAKTGAVVLAVTALTLTGAPAQAAKRQVVTVPCSSAALATAIAAANLTPTTLRLAANCTYDVMTASAPGDAALPVITGNVSLVGGPSTTIRRNTAAGAVRLFDVSVNGTLSVSGIFLLNGAPATGTGGAIQVNGALTLNQVTVSGNTTTANGGGVGITPTGRATIFRTLVGENTATGGSGGGIDNLGSLTFEDSQATSNNATDAAGGGGGIATQTGATSRVLQSTLDHNLTAGGGGAIRNLGTTIVDHTLIQLNTATVNGGGIFNVPPGIVSVTVSIIRNNTPNNCFPLNTIAGCVN